MGRFLSTGAFWCPSSHCTNGCTTTGTIYPDATNSDDGAQHFPRSQYITENGTWRPLLTYSWQKKHSPGPRGTRRVSTSSERVVRWFLHSSPQDSRLRWSLHTLHGLSPHYTNHLRHSRSRSPKKAVSRLTLSDATSSGKPMSQRRIRCQKWTDGKPQSIRFTTNPGNNGNDGTNVHTTTITRRLIIVVIAATRSIPLT